MGSFSMFSTKVAPAPQSVELDSAFQAAKDDVIRLIQQQENETFFNRLFIIPVRNFLHLKFPTVTLFKSPFELAVEKFAQLRAQKSAAIENDQAKSSSKNKSYSLFGTGQSQQVDPRLQEIQTAETEIGRALQHFVITKITSQEKELGESLQQYIATQITQSTTPAPSEQDDPETLWANVCSKISTSSSPVLDDVLSKLYRLYPITAEYNQSYESKQKKTTESVTQSTAKMMNQQGVSRASSAETTRSSNSDNSFSILNLFTSEPLTPEEQFDIKVAEYQKEIGQLYYQVKKGGKGGTCCFIAKIKPLQESLTKLLDTKIAPSDLSIADKKNLNKYIEKLISEARIDLIDNANLKWASHEQESYIVQAKQTLNFLYQNIKALDCNPGLSVSHNNNRNM